MADGKQERFNVWAAYVDLFSNMLAFILMVGLIAATSGGAVSGSQHACARSTGADSDLAPALDALAYAVGAGDSELQPGPNCELMLVPRQPNAPWLHKTAYLLFWRGSADFCWEHSGRNHDDFDCDQEAIDDKTDNEGISVNLENLCSAIKNMLDAIVEFDRGRAEKSGYKVAIVGHTSKEWNPNGKKGKGTCSSDSVPRILQGDERRDACNYELSLKRAQTVFAICRSHLAGSGRHFSDYSDILVLGGEAHLSSRVSAAVGDVSGQDADKEDKYSHDERRVSISVYAPGGHI